MYLIVDGLVAYGKDRGNGRLVFTGSSIHALRTQAGAAMMGGAIGGLLGALIGMLIDRSRKPKQAPEFVNDPELSYLSDKERKALLNTRLLAKLPIDASLMVRRTMFGFKITAGSDETIDFKGKIHQKKITAFLEQRGVMVSR